MVLKHTVFIFGFMVCVLRIQAQNLVPNPGFEEYFRCPGSWNYKSYIKRLAPGWSTPTNGTPDLFNACSSGDTGIPHNFAGTASPHNGNGYAGIYVWHKNRDYREYLQAKLTRRLEKGKRYAIEFYFRLASYSRYSIDRTGAALLPDSVAPKNHDMVLPVHPALLVVHDSAFHRSSGTWERAALDYTADGTERFIIIGNFSPNRETKSFYLGFEAQQEPMLANSAYFYIDDVRVEEIMSEGPVFPRDDMKPDVVYTLSTVNFEYDSDVLTPASLPELENVISVLNRNTNWSIALTGHTDDRGSDGYNQDLSERRAAKCKSYLVSKGISPLRISTEGKGKSVPVMAGTTEESRAANRRVEAVFTERK